MSECRSKETRILKVVWMLQLDLASSIEHCRSGLHNLVLGLLVCIVVVRPFRHRVVLAIGEELDSFDCLIPIIGVPPPALVVLLESSTDESLTNVRQTLVSKIMGEFEPIVFSLIYALALKKLEAFRIPRTSTSVSE